MAPCDRIFVEKLTLTDFRNYEAATITAGPTPAVIVGPNGAGKTNCLEALSLLTAGRGLRGVPFHELARKGAHGAWAVAARVFLGEREVAIGTGMRPAEDAQPPAVRASRLVKIDGAPARSSSALADVRMVWLTPAMDGLFTGPASERRRFLDRFVLGLNPGYATAAAAFERAMRQRNRALELAAAPAVLDAIETEMAAAAVKVANARRQAVALLSHEILSERDRKAGATAVFPWAEVALAGELERELEQEAAEHVTARYARRLEEGRLRDEAAGRTLFGPHRSDLVVSHGPKDTAAKLCSTGEQKALLIALVLAQARLIKAQAGGLAPLVLLDEIAAHLDEERRTLLFEALLTLNGQVWMTGTDVSTFAALQEGGTAQFFHVSNGVITPLKRA